MSGTQDHAHAHDSSHDDAHEGPIKTPKQLMWAVGLAIIVPVMVIVMLASYVTSEIKPSAGSDALEGKALAARIQPIGAVEVKDVNDVASMKTGEQVFQAQCSACHATGAVGSPKFGDAAAWGPRIAKGFDALLNSALHGKGNMTPQGGGDFSDFEVARAVVYMANHGGAHFDEPKAPAAADAASAATASSAAASN